MVIEIDSINNTFIVIKYCNLCTVNIEVLEGGLPALVRIVLICIPSVNNLSHTISIHTREIIGFPVSIMAALNTVTILNGFMH